MHDPNGTPERDHQWNHAGALVHLHSVPGKGHAMMKGPDEMRVLMAFWAKSLKHRPVDQEQGTTSEVMEIDNSCGALDCLRTSGMSN